jgi:hypothetical protein
LNRDVCSQKKTNISTPSGMEARKEAHKNSILRATPYHSHLEPLIEALIRPVSEMSKKFQVQ